MIKPKDREKGDLFLKGMWIYSHMSFLYMQYTILLLLVNENLPDTENVLQNMNMLLVSRRVSN